MGARSCVAAVVMMAGAASANTLAPGAPVLETSARTFVAFAGQPAAVTVTWAPVAGAVKYKARWATGDRFVEEDLTAPSFARAEAKAGAHVLSVVAVDAAGLESPPADLALDVVSVEAVAVGGQAPDAPATSAYAVGAKFSSPGLMCQIDDGPRGYEVVAVVPGAVKLRCGGEGKPVVEVPLVIARVKVAGELAPIARDVETKVHVSLASIGAIGEHLEVAAVGDLDLGPAVRVAGGLDLTVTAGAVGPAGLIVRANGLELGRVALAVVDAPAPAAAAPAPVDWFALDLGVHAGGLILPDVGGDATNLGHPRTPGDTLSARPLFGISLGLFPTRRVGIEVESAVVVASYAERLGTAPLLITRGQLAARLVEDGRFGLRGLVGGDALTTLSSEGTVRVGTLGGVHYGAAFSIETRPGVSIRVEALDVITIAQNAGYAHCLELQIGVVTRLGRRDRWK